MEMVMGVIMKYICSSRVRVYQQRRTSERCFGFRKAGLSG